MASEIVSCVGAVTNYVDCRCCFSVGCPLGVARNCNTTNVILTFNNILINDISTITVIIIVAVLNAVIVTTNALNTVIVSANVLNVNLTANVLNSVIVTANVLNVVTVVTIVLNCIIITVNIVLGTAVVYFTVNIWSSEFNGDKLSSSGMRPANVFC